MPPGLKPGSVSIGRRGSGLSIADMEGYCCRQHSRGGRVTTEWTTGRFRGGEKRTHTTRYLRGAKRIEQTAVLNRKLRQLVKCVHSFFGSEGDSTWWPSPSPDEPEPVDASSSSSDGLDCVSSSEECQLRLRVCFVLACEVTMYFAMDLYGCCVMPPGRGRSGASTHTSLGSSYQLWGNTHRTLPGQFSPVPDLDQ